MARSAVWLAILVAIAALASAGRGTPAAASEVVGTIVAMQQVAAAEGTNMTEVDLRIDAAKGTETPGQPGEVIKVRLPVEAVPQMRPVGTGDQVQVEVELGSGEGSETPYWVATGRLVILGRGEFINPGEGADTDLGSPEGKVLVKMFAPLAPQCHQETARLLQELAGREPERLRVQIFDMMKPAGRRELQRERLTCATVLVNNRYEFTLEGPRPVALSHRPNAPQSSYNSEDVVVVVEQEIKRLYGEESKPETDDAAPEGAASAPET
jgi:hypothetical protein